MLVSLSLRNKWKANYLQCYDGLTKNGDKRIGTRDMKDYLAGTYRLVTRDEVLERSYRICPGDYFSMCLKVG